MNMNMQQQPKAGMSKGCLIGGIVVGLLLVGAVVLALVGGGAYILLGKESSESPQPASGQSDTTSSSSSSSSSSTSQKPKATSAQEQAIAGGKEVIWESQGITWKVPASWSEVNEARETISWQSPGGFEGGHLIGSISAFAPGTLPVDISLNAMLQQVEGDKKIGKVAKCGMLELGGVKGVWHEEASPSDPNDFRRVTWRGYRDYSGQQQLITIILSTDGKSFAKHEDAFYGILYSTQIGK
jgi:hypothetical protein